MGVKVKLLDICRPKQWKTISGAELQAEGFPVYGANGIIGCYSEYNHEQPTLLIGCRGTCGSVCISRARSWINGNAMCLDSLSSDVSLDFLFHQLKNFDFRKVISGTSQPQITQSGLAKIDVVLPSLAEQKRIAGELDRICELKKNAEERLALMDQLVKSKFVEMFASPDLEHRIWEDVFETRTGKLDSNAAVEGGEFPFFTCAKEPLAINTYAFDQEALLLAGNNAAGVYDVKHYAGKFNAYQRTYVLRLKDEKWAYPLFKIQLEDKLNLLQNQSRGTTTKYLTMGILRKLRFVIPPIKEQRKFAAFVESVDKSKAALKETIATMETLYKERLQEYFA